MSAFHFKLKPGHWYIFITCRECHHTQVLFPDLTEGEGTFEATYVWRCPECGYRGDYDGSDLERIQWERPDS